MKKTILKLSALLLIASTTFTSCTKDDDKKTTSTTGTTPAGKTIVELAQGDTTLSILVTALTKAGLVSTLQGAGTFTVFAPTNDAFRKAEVTTELINSITDPADIQELKNTLLFHVLGTKVLSTQLTNTYVPTLYTVGGNGVSLQVNIAPVKFNNSASVVTADISASNGVIHKINKPMDIPTVADIAINNSNFTTLVAALTKAELVETVEETENITVFAPVNKAFSDINFNLEANSKADLTPILTAHVLGSSVRSSAITNGLKATALNTAVQLTFNTSAGVKFSGGKTNDISVTTADIQAENGVVHVIDKVIIP
jgi:transforming growth factor-beta-induced protein